MDGNGSDRSQATDARRRAILEAALQSFATKGFSQTTMEDIRQLSGASTGSIYHHFNNKEMLAFALFLDGREALNAAMHEALVTADSPQVGVSALVRAYLDWFASHPDHGQYILQVGMTEVLGAYVKVLRQKTMAPLPLETFPQQLYDWLAPSIEAGVVHRVPATLYFPLIIGPSREFVRRWLRTRVLADMVEAKEPLATAAWAVLAP